MMVPSLCRERCERLIISAVWSLSGVPNMMLKLPARGACPPNCPPSRTPTCPLYINEDAPLPCQQRFTFYHSCLQAQASNNTSTSVSKAADIIAEFSSAMGKSKATARTTAQKKQQTTGSKTHRQPKPTTIAHEAK